MDDEQNKSATKPIGFVFLLLGIITAIIFFTKQGLNVKLPRNNPFLSTQSDNTVKPTQTTTVLLTNANNNKTITLQKNQIIDLEFRLNKKSNNLLQVDNNKVLAINEVLKFNSAKDLFQATLKTLETGKSIVSVTDPRLSAKVLSFTIAVE
jgi:hypothetical protein